MKEGDGGQGEEREDREKGERERMLPRRESERERVLRAPGVEPRHEGTQRAGPFGVEDTPVRVWARLA
jgi:hypothetical protein